MQTRVPGRYKHVYRDGTNMCTETIQAQVSRRYKDRGGLMDDALVNIDFKLFSVLFPA